MSEHGPFTATIGGDKLYQQRAREALPLLVRQAEAGELIYYSDLAAELGMPNPQNLNYVLGAIGNTLAELSRMWRADIPPIQCVAVSKATGIPGEGISGFLSNAVDFKSLSRSRRREIVKAELQRIFTYRRWRDVLGTLGLPYVQPDFSAVNRAASRFGGAESEAHKQLKEYVARTPRLLGLGAAVAAGVTEHALPSGDSLDVSFETQDYWVAAEVKSLRSPEADIVRGLYQCVKYLAVMQAVRASEGRERSARVVLILGDRLPAKLIALKNLLGVEVIDSIVPT